MKEPRLAKEEFQLAGPIKLTRWNRGRQCPTEEVIVDGRGGESENRESCPAQPRFLEVVLAGLKNIPKWQKHVNILNVFMTYAPVV